MAKIKYVVTELNKPSALALANLNQKVCSLLLDNNDKNFVNRDDSEDGLKTA